MKNRITLALRLIVLALGLLAAYDLFWPFAVDNHRITDPIAALQAVVIGIVLIALAEIMDKNVGRDVRKSA